MADEATSQTSILWFFPLKIAQMCTLVLSWWKIVFFFLKWGRFSRILLLNQSKMRHSRPTFQLLLLLVIQNHIVVLSIISVVVTSTGCPEWGSSCVDVRPRLNSLTSYCAMNFTQLTFYLFWFKPFQCKCFVTAQNSRFPFFKIKRSLLAKTTITMKSDDKFNINYISCVLSSEASPAINKPFSILWAMFVS